MNTSFEASGAPATVTITAFTDPYCTWCWGSEPILGKIKTVFGDQVGFNYVMGGLIRNIDEFQDPANGIGGEMWHQQAADHWEDASSRHHMPVDVAVVGDIKGDFKSTHPACIATKAAELQNVELSHRYLRRLREAGAAERLPIHHRDVQIALAGEVGLDLARFKNDLISGAAKSAFEDDLRSCVRHGVSGFPTYLLQAQDGRNIMLNGYVPYNVFQHWLQELGAKDNGQSTPTFDSTSLYKFVERTGKTAPAEVAMVFEVTHDQATKMLSEMAGKSLFEEIVSGTGSLFAVPSADAMCDMETGACG